MAGGDDRRLRAVELMDARDWDAALGLLFDVVNDAEVAHSFVCERIFGIIWERGGVWTLMAESGYEPGVAGSEESPETKKKRPASSGQKSA
jgi:hypothetical protein